MRVLSIILIIALVLFTIWQIYLTIKKIVDKKKRKGVVTTQIKSEEVQTSNNDNSKKEEIE